MRVLIAETNPGPAREVQDVLKAQGHFGEVCHTGKDCARLLYCHDYDLLILDHSIKNFSATEVVSYADKVAPRLAIVLAVGDLNFNPRGVIALSEKLAGVIEKPYSKENLSRYIQQDGFSSWRRYTGKMPAREYSVEDGDGYTALSLSHFVAGRINPVDYYLRLAEKKFLKILRAGDLFEKRQLDILVLQKKLQTLYIKDRDRGIYINFMNDHLKNASAKPEHRFELTRFVAKKYLEGAFHQGLSREYAQEGVALCENIFCTINKEERLFDMLNGLRLREEDSFQRYFMTAFFCVVISRHIDWMTPRTIHYVVMAALLQDIGFTVLPSEFQNLKDCRTPESLQRHLAHSILGAKLLEELPSIPYPVIQTVEQHHERCNGTGGPKRLTINQIFPLAKILGLACDFYDHTVAEKLTPLESLNDFVPLYGVSSKHDPQIVRALIKGFIRPKD